MSVGSINSDFEAKFDAYNELIDAAAGVAFNRAISDTKSQLDSLDENSALKKAVISGNEDGVL